MYEMKAK